VNEALVQALIRAIVGAALAAVTFLIANFTIISGAIPDPGQAALVLTVGVGILNFIAKLLGGPTQAAARSVGRGIGEFKRPNILSV